MSQLLSARIVTVLLLLILGWILAAFYGFLAKQFVPGWFPIALLHTGAAFAVWWFGKSLRLPVRRGWVAYAPAALVLIGSGLLALATRLLLDPAEPTLRSWDPQLLAFVIWIPIVEEMVFRFGLGGALRHRLGDFWGTYGSALVFAMAHGSSSLGHVTMPIGPLLLGLSCGWLYMASGRLSAAIALHAACNASGWIFSALDPRWLEWLQALYLKL